MIIFYAFYREKNHQKTYKNNYTAYYEIIKQYSAD